MEGNLKNGGNNTRKEIIKLFFSISQSTLPEKDTLRMFESSRESTDNLNHDDKYNLLQFFNLLIEIDQRNKSNAYHVSPLQKGGEKNKYNKPTQAGAMQVF